MKRQRRSARLKESNLEIRIGNSDIIANVLYKHSKELLNIITLVKKTGKVEKIVWSEMIYKIHSKNNPYQFTKKATRYSQMSNQ